MVHSTCKQVVRGVCTGRGWCDKSTLRQMCVVNLTLSYESRGIPYPPTDRAAEKEQASVSATVLDPAPLLQPEGKENLWRGWRVVSYSPLG
jgi:hypothetical protein